MTMQPLSTFPSTPLPAAILTDIDDTLTDEGRLPARAYDALERLAASGMIVIPVTGRPAGWCDLIARQWPAHAVVGENGAFYFRYDDRTRTLTRRYAKPADQRAADRARLAAIEREVLAVVPGAAVAADQAYREADLAIDFCEDVPRLPAEAVARIVAVFERHGAVAKVSSIHVNGWFGGYDKLTTSLACLDECFGIDGRARNESIVYAGDSPNDAPMFAAFRRSVGVANVRDFIDTIPAKPAYVTPSRGADGFVELAERLLALRSGAAVT
jgi:HAD superfamily hydrolase (TIGR01484 family)